MVKRVCAWEEQAVFGEMATIVQLGRVACLMGSTCAYVLL